MEMPAINVNDVLKDITVKVKIKGTKKIKTRLMVAQYLFRLGAWVAGMGIEIDQNIEEA